MINLLKPHTWSRYYSKPPTPASLTPEVTYKRNLLLSQLCVLSIIVTTAHLILDFFTGAPIAVVMDLVIVIGIATCYILNEQGYHGWAKGFLTIFMNIVLFIYANIIPKENGIYFLFFPLVSLYFVIFEKQEYWGRYGLSVLTVMFFLALEFSNYSLFGSRWTIEQPDRISYFFNFITAIFLLFFSFNFLVKANYKAEKQLKEQADLILDQNKYLEKTNKELDLFVYRSSHDMRAPLTSIQGLINLLQTEQLNEVQKDYLRRIETRIDKLGNFINEITQYSRNIRLDVLEEPVDLNKIVEEVIEIHRFYKHAGCIKTIVNIDIDKTFLSDKNRLFILVNNLYFNAIKYHNTNQQNPHIIIDAWLEQEILNIKIADNGIGINPSIQDKIFNMFYRGHESSDGSGLGLFIVMEVLDKLGGKIEFHSKHHFGSEFKLSIPVKV